MCMSALIWAEIETLVYSVDTIKDANKYWPQRSNISPAQLCNHIVLGNTPQIMANVAYEEGLVLFTKCEQIVSTSKTIKNPPNKSK